MKSCLDTRVVTEEPETPCLLPGFTVQEENLAETPVLHADPLALIVASRLNQLQNLRKIRAQELLCLAAPQSAQSKGLVCASPLGGKCLGLGTEARFKQPQTPPQRPLSTQTSVPSSFEGKMSPKKHQRKRISNKEFKLLMKQRKKESAKIKPWNVRKCEKRSTSGQIHANPHGQILAKQKIEEEQLQELLQSKWWTEVESEKVAGVDMNVKNSKLRKSEVFLSGSAESLAKVEVLQTLLQMMLVAHACAKHELCERLWQSRHLNDAAISKTFESFEFDLQPLLDAFFLIPSGSLIVHHLIQEVLLERSSCSLQSDAQMATMSWRSALHNAYSKAVP